MVKCYVLIVIFTIFGSLVQFSSASTDVCVSGYIDQRHCLINNTEFYSDTFAAYTHNTEVIINNSTIKCKNFASTGNCSLIFNGTSKITITNSIIHVKEIFFKTERTTALGSLGSLEIINSQISTNGTVQGGPGSSNSDRYGHAFAGVSSYCLATDSSEKVVAGWHPHDYGRFAYNRDELSLHTEKTIGSGGKEVIVYGGGRIVFIIPNYTLLENSYITANGNPREGGSCSFPAIKNGGSGGFIFIETFLLEIKMPNRKETPIQARGGGYCGFLEKGKNYGQGGSGGRILILTETEVKGRDIREAVNAMGGTELQTDQGGNMPCQIGAAGTIYIQKNQDYSYLIISNAQGQPTETPTVIDDFKSFGGLKLPHLSIINVTIGARATFAVSWRNHEDEEVTDDYFVHTEIFNIDPMCQIVPYHINSSAMIFPDNSVTITTNTLKMDTFAKMTFATSVLINANISVELGKDSLITGPRNISISARDKLTINGDIYSSKPQSVRSYAYVILTSSSIDCPEAKSNISGESVYLGGEDINIKCIVMSNRSACTQSVRPEMTENFESAIDEISNYQEQIRYDDWWSRNEEFPTRFFGVTLVSAKGRIELGAGAKVVGAKIAFFADSLEMLAHSFVSTSGMGCSPNDGPGAGNVNVFPSFDCAGNGGSYGGVGGIGLASGDTQSQKCLQLTKDIREKKTPVYGTEANPFFEGSGGGARDIEKGGKGGGFVFIQTDECYIDGYVGANGMAPQPTAPPKLPPGAGSGGSIQIRTNSLGGNGTFSANGGDGIGVGGEGGGGRIHFKFLRWDEETSYPSMSEYWNGTAMVNPGLNGTGMPERYAKAGVISSTSCLPGFSGTFCRPCPVGFYSDNNSTENCTMCQNKPENAVYRMSAWKNSNCPYDCSNITFSKQYNPECLLPHMYYISGMQSHIGWILFGLLLFLTTTGFILRILRNKAMKTLQTQVGNSSPTGHKAEELDDEAEGCNLRDNDVNYIVHRIYLHGDNSYDNPWYLDETLPKEIDYLFIASEYRELVKNVNGSNKWSSIKKFFIRFLNVICPPLGWLVALRFRKSKFKHLKSEFDSVNNNLRHANKTSLMYYALKVWASNDYSLARVDIVNYEVGQIESHGSHGGLSGGPTSLPYTFFLAGHGSFPLPFNFDRRDPALNLVLMKLSEAAGIYSSGSSMNEIPDPDTSGMKDPTNSLPVRLVKENFTRFCHDLNLKAQLINFYSRYQDFERAIITLVEYIKSENYSYFAKAGLHIDLLILQVPTAANRKKHRDSKITLIENPKSEKLPVFLEELQQSYFKRKIDIKLALFISGESVSSHEELPYYTGEETSRNYGNYIITPKATDLSVAHSNNGHDSDESDASEASVNEFATMKQQLLSKMKKGKLKTSKRKKSNHEHHSQPKEETYTHSLSITGPKEKKPKGLKFGQKVHRFLGLVTTVFARYNQPSGNPRIIQGLLAFFTLLQMFAIGIILQDLQLGHRADIVSLLLPYPLVTFIAPCCTWVWVLTSKKKLGKVALVLNLMGLLNVIFDIILVMSKTGDSWVLRSSLLSAKIFMMAVWIMVNQIGIRFLTVEVPRKELKINTTHSPMTGSRGGSPLKLPSRMATPMNGASAAPAASHFWKKAPSFQI